MPGRKPTYDEARVSRALELLARGDKLRVACKKAGVKAGSLSVWAINDTPPGIRARYFAALQAKYLLEAERILEITDSVEGSNSMAAVQAAKSMADRRAWLASRLLSEFAEQQRPLPAISAARVVIYLPGKPPQDGSDAKVIEGHSSDLISAGSDEKPEA